MRRRRLCALALWIGLVPPALAWAATPSSSPTTPPKAKPTARSPARKPPLDFSGVWELDVEASRNPPPNVQKGLTLSVRQTGDRIWLEPIGPDREKVLAEILVADGRAYEKAMGRPGKALVTTRWGPDGKALFIEIVAGQPGDPGTAIQRSRWTLSADRKRWTRETVTLEPVGTRHTRLVFLRQKAAPKKTAPPKTPPPAKD